MVEVPTFFNKAKKHNNSYVLTTKRIKKMEKPKNYISVYVSKEDSKKILNAEEKSALKRELTKTKFEGHTNEITLYLLSIKYGKVGDYYKRREKYLIDAINLAKAILILKQRKPVITIKKGTGKAESVELPQSINTDFILNELCNLFDEREYTRCYTMEEAKTLIDEDYIDDYVLWWYGGSRQGFEKWKDADKFKEFYDKENEEMLKAFIRDNWQAIPVIAEYEAGLKQFIKQSEEEIEYNKAVDKDLKYYVLIAVAYTFAKYEYEKPLGRKDFSTIYECLKILGMIKPDEDKTRNKDSREKFVSHYCKEAPEYSMNFHWPSGFRSTFLNGEKDN